MNEKTKYKTPIVEELDARGGSSATIGSAPVDYEHGPTPEEAYVGTILSIAEGNIVGMMRDMRLRQKLPRIVCLCGSTRFMVAFRLANLSETLAGRIVLTIGCDTKSDSDLLKLGELTPEIKRELDELHKRKIDLANEIFVLNVGGYIGESTRSEIEYAQKLNKPVRYLEQNDRTQPRRDNP